jgi:hypothetical protein
MIETDAIDPVTGHSVQAEAIIVAAKAEAGSAVVRIAQRAGSSVTDVPRWRDSTATIQRAEPQLGLRAAKQLSDMVKREILDYIAACRGRGVPWQEVGVLLQLGPDAAAMDKPLAVVAWDYATGRPVLPGYTEPDTTLWDCWGCGRMVHDYGPTRSPAVAEAGHADRCEQLAAAVAQWEAEADEREDIPRDA